MRPDSPKDGPLAAPPAWPEPQAGPRGHPRSRTSCECSPRPSLFMFFQRLRLGHTWEQRGPFTKRFGEGHHQPGTE